MKKIIFPILLLSGAILLIGVLLLRVEKSKPKQISTAKNIPCIATFMDGGGPYYQPNSPFRTKISPEQTNGEQLTVSGKILLNDCKTPVANAVLDIWQANETGNYEDVWYRGQVKTDKNGNYFFETVVPKGYGEGTGYRPPHIHFKVFINNQEIITSQIFFPEVKGKEGFNDAYIMTLKTEDQDGKKVHKGQHNIILP